MSHDAISTFKFTHTRNNRAGGDWRATFITRLARARRNLQLFEFTMEIKRPSVASQWTSEARK